MNNGKDEALIAQTIELQKEVAGGTFSQTESEQKNANVRANMDELKPKPSRSFHRDIPEDAHGVSFHRLQLLVWTLVPGLLFLYAVWKRLSMPDFDAALLVLEGITAGTYPGFKFSETQA